MAKAAARRSKSYSDGLKVRRRWMGGEYVERAFRDADDFHVAKRVLAETAHS